MRIGFAGACVAAAVVGWPALGADDLDARVRGVASGSDAITASELGRSREGRSIHLLTVGTGETGSKPAVLIVGGVNGDHLFGADVALGVAEAVARDHAEMLDGVTLYVVPRLNRDAAARHLGENPGMSFDRTATPVDEDRDGRVDEDGPKDLNGDGVITMMRVANPPSWMERTHVVDGADSRLMRAPDPKKGEAATHAVMIEGEDVDGDGRFAEDGEGGVSLDWNFPHHWQEHDDRAGAYALSEVEARALATWLLERENVQAVIVYGPHDSVVKIPVAGKMDGTGEAPEGIEDGDKWLYEAVSESFKKLTKMKETPGDHRDGALHSWAYAQLGIASFSTPVWVRPDQLEAEKKKDGEEKEDGGEEEAAEPAEEERDALIGGMTLAEIDAMVAEFQAAQSANDEAKLQEMMTAYRSYPPELQRALMARAQGEEVQAGGGGGGEGGGGEDAVDGGEVDKDEKAWLAYIDEQREGAGFVAWSAFEHPQLGEVEIGGFEPRVRMSPPEEEMERLVGEQASFAADLLGKLARVEVGEAQIERMGDGLWRVRVEVRNTGWMPTGLAIQEKVRRLLPTNLRLEEGVARLLAGERLQRERTIPGGGTFAGEWIVAGDAGDSVRISARSSQLGERIIEAELGEGSGR